MDVDYAPTGREFVAGGYDRSVRIFAHNGGHSREVGTPARCSSICMRHHPRPLCDASFVMAAVEGNLRVTLLCGAPWPLGAWAWCMRVFDEHRQ